MIERGDRLLIEAGMLIGVGLGGFVDGIVLHQILQWHEMISSVLPPTNLIAVKVNMLWDGVFHAAMWFVTLAGIVTLAQAVNAPRSLDVKRPFIGAALVGWGTFNVVEGLIDHQLLGIHHVHPGDHQAAWDIGFIVLSSVLACIGTVVLVRSLTNPTLRPAT